MDTKAVLTKAVQKALDNGWQLPFEEPLLGFEVTQEDVDGVYQTDPYIRFEIDGAMDWCVGIPHLIFDHDFVKALWGEEATYDMTHTVQPDGTYRMHVIPAWQYHLQQMVIADGPIKYLEEHI